MIDRRRHFCYIVNLILSPEKGGASTHEYLGEFTLNQTNFLQYAINQTV